MTPYFKIVIQFEPCYINYSDLNFLQWKQVV